MQDARETELETEAEDGGDMAAEEGADAVDGMQILDDCERTFRFDTVHFPPESALEGAVSGQAPPLEPYRAPRPNR